LKPQIPWLRVFVEGVVIVGSILLAFGIDAWWEERQERVQEQEVLSSVRAELEENVGLVDDWFATHRRVDDAAREFLEVISDAQEGDADPVADSIIGEVIRGPTYEPVRASLDAAVSSGRMEVIRSEEVQRGLARWSRLLAEASEEEQDGREFVRSQLLPHLNQTADVSEAARLYVSSTAQGESGVLPWSDTESEVIVSGELRNLLWRRRFLAHTAIRSLTEVKEHASQTLSILDTEIR
jgi:hypothetical protein